MLAIDGVWLHSSKGRLLLEVLMLSDNSCGLHSTESTALSSAIAELHIYAATIGGLQMA